MKKRFIFICLFVIAMIVGIAAFNFKLNLNTKSNYLSKVALANVEALAEDETVPKGYASVTKTDGGIQTVYVNGVPFRCRLNIVSCIGTGSYDCPPSYYDSCVPAIIV